MISFISNFKYLKKLRDDFDVRIKLNNIDKDNKIFLNHCA